MNAVPPKACMWVLQGAGAGHQLSHFRSPGQRGLITVTRRLGAAHERRNDPSGAHFLNHMLHAVRKVHTCRLNERGHRPPGCNSHNAYTGLTASRLLLMKGVARSRRSLWDNAGRQIPRHILERAQERDQFQIGRPQASELARWQSRGAPPGAKKGEEVEPPSQRRRRGKCWSSM